MKILATAILLLLSQFCFATNHYWSTSGSNSNSGLTPLLPKQTIGQLNVDMSGYAANDSILFKCGEVFYGGVIVPKLGLKFGSYGTGAKPIITGFTTVSGWVNLGGNIWEAPVASVKPTVNLVEKDDTIQAVGRYPNANAANGGYVTTTATSSTSVTTPMLSSTTNWTGAEMVMRLDRWDIKKVTLSSHAAGVMSFPSFGRTSVVGFGVFIQRDPRTLDQNGEWYWNSSTNKLRMYFSDNNPTGHVVKISTVDTLFKSIYSFITIKDIEFRGAGKYAIYHIGGTDRIITNVTARNNNTNAIFCQSQTANVFIDNCTVISTQGTGIRVYSAGLFNAYVKNCIVDKTGLLIGLLPSYNENDPISGIQVNIVGSDSLQVRKNRVTNSGYNPISWGGDSAWITNNFVDSFCSVLDDGGGIYTVENQGGPSATLRHNRYVIGNIVGNAIGALAGTTGAFNTGVNGYYSDLGSRDITYDGNTVFNVPGNGFHGNNNKNLTFTNNTTFNCKQSLSTQRFGGANPGDPMRGFISKHNIFSNYRWQYINAAINLPSVITITADITAMGTFDSNYYATNVGVDTSMTTFTRYADNSNQQGTFYRAFSYITGTLSQEIHSINFANNGRLEYNASDTIRQVVFTDSIFREPDGTLDTNAVNIPRWGSKILIFVGKVNTPPVVDAGSDQSITLPITSVPVTGSSSDPGGSIASRLWSQLSGPATVSFTAATSNSTVINGLTVAGNYVIQFAATDNLGATSSDFMQVLVNPAIPPANVPPTVNAGSDVTITLPTTTTSFTATANDPDGSIASYAWTFLSGPTAPSITSASTATTGITGLTVEGDYFFLVTVTDNLGATASDAIKVTVNPLITTPPIPDAGIDRNITLPQTAITLTGSGADGTNCAINSNTWTLISNPVGSFPVITDDADYNSTFTNMLVPGQYRLRLTVTGACGSTVSDDIIINVSAASVYCNCFPTYTKFEN